MKILIIACTDIKTDPRVQRQIKALQGHEIITCGGVNADYDFYKAPPPSLYRKLKRFFWLMSGQFEKFYWTENLNVVLSKLYDRYWDAIIANDIDTLPLALAIREVKGMNRMYCKVYFDAHEYHPKEWASLKWKLLYKKYKSYLCKKYIPQANSFSTVSLSIANEYKKFTGRKPEVVTNATEYRDLKPLVVKSPVTLIHHGASVPERKIEQMIHMMDYLDNHVLYLMLTDFDTDYLYFLQDFRSDKVRFLPPVSPENVCRVLNDFDIGVYILPPSNFNNINALPNKIFDFIQARLALAVSPNPEMARLVRQYDLGVVAENYTPKAMAKAIGELKKEDIISYKNCSHMAAKELSAEKNYEIIRRLIN